MSVERNFVEKNIKHSLKMKGIVTVLMFHLALAQGSVDGHKGEIFRLFNNILKHTYISLINSPANPLSLYIKTVINLFIKSLTNLQTINNQFKSA